MSQIRSQETDETGAVAIVVALVMVPLIAVAAIGIDASLLFVERAKAQAAADHSAMSAAWASCHDQDPIAAGQHIGSANGFTASQLALASVDTHTYKATISSLVDYFFAPVIGFNQGSLTAQAVAKCTVSSAGGPALFATGNMCDSYDKPHIDISGSVQQITGLIYGHSSRVGGSNNDFDGPFKYVTSIDLSGSDNQFLPGYPQQVGPIPPPVSFSLGDYAALSQNGNPSHHFVDGDIDGAFIEANGDGLYYATGLIKLDRSDVDLDVTLVAEETVEISGSNQDLEPYVDGLLAFGGKSYLGSERCDKFVTSVSGSNSEWKGIFYGPGGLVEFNGSTNTAITGSAIGSSIRLNGSNYSFTGGGGFSSFDMELLE